MAHRHMIFELHTSRSKIGTEIQGRTALSYILKIPIQKRGKDQK